MSLPSTGPLSMSQIRTALGSQTTNFGLAQAEQGVFGINSFSAQVGPGLLLDGVAPFKMSNWRGYNNACQQVSIQSSSGFPPTINPFGFEITQGQSITLTASGASSFSWSTGQSTAQITVTPSTSTTFTVTGIRSGCKNTSTSITVTVNQFSDEIEATTTTTTTATPPSGCQCLELYGGDGGGTLFNVFNCNEELEERFVPPKEYLFICALDYGFDGSAQDGAYAEFNPDPSSSPGWPGEGCEECLNK